MTFFTRILCFLMIMSLALVGKSFGQTGVLNPDDPIVVYNPDAPPAQPAYGTLAKWVKTNRLGFNTSSFKSYIYKGVAFRLKFPKSYKDNINNPDKKYPIFVFFHGIGEKGTIYDNEYQLYHGGELFMNAVDQDKFDGFLLYPQTSSGSGAFNGTHYSIINELINNYFVPQVKVDINRVIVDGLSGGGGSSWQMLTNYPRLVAAGLPISACSVADGDAGLVNTLKFTPIWLFQGFLDNAPHFNTSRNVVNNYKNAGSNITYTEYPDQGHGCWYSAWNDPNFFPYILKAHKANPWPLFGRTEFCPGDPISATMGVTAGFDGYEWAKDNVTIPGATSNQYTATTLGTYSVRIKRGSTWSVWSPIPVVIKLKSATISPDITVTGFKSNVIPSPDGSTSIQLQVPDGYTSYSWQKDGSASVLGTTRFLTVSAAGSYKVKVTEQFGCSSEFSNPFAVIDANGPNAPAAVSGVTATALSKTSIKLDWSQNPAPAFNETGFEIYRAGSSSGPFALIKVTAPDVNTFTDLNLNSNSDYYYKIRAINTTAASAASDAVTAKTLADIQAPSAPGNLRTAGSSRNSVTLIWDAATDDVGVTVYDVYVNGVKYYETDETQFTVYNLQHGQTYTFRVKARDFANNVSPFSNQVAAQALLNGLSYKFYTFTGQWNKLPDFSELDPVATGLVPNVTIDNRSQNDNFGYLWEGFITIPVAGNYTFRTNSDDGSRLYLAPYSFSATPLVDNDGLHGGQDRDGTIFLNAGTYPFTATFYEQGGGEVMNVSWKIPGSDNFVPIPNSAFSDAPTVDGQAPVKPSNLAATAVTYKRIDLTWTDNSDNETGFEIWRSTNPTDNFATIGNAAANATSYADSTLQAGTTYYYRIKAIGQYGQSDFDRVGAGIGYSYYEIGNMDVLPNFNSVVPKKTGRIGTFDISPRDRGDDFAFKFDGYINVPTNGNYTFYTASDDGSKLYLDGFSEANLVVNNDGLHGTVEQSGTKFLTAGLHQITATFFERGGGEVMEVRYEGPGIGKQLIPANVLGELLVNATTPAAPNPPAAPTGLLADGVSTNTISVTWTDNATDETGYALYRSADNNGNYVQFAVLPANTTSFTDTALFANSVFYYKVIAKNEGGNSAFSNEDSAITRNHIPTIAAIGDQYMRFGTQLQLNVVATDLDPETLTLNVTNLPAFASFTPTGNGTGTITFNPLISNLGTFDNITVAVTDAHEGSSSVSFKLIVDDNHQPVLAATNNVSLSEKQTTQINLSATDQNASDAITWSFTNLPSFVTPVINNRDVQLTIAPGYSDNGSYRVGVKVDDGNDGTDTLSFLITVNDVNPNKTVYVNLSDATAALQAPAPWNNISKLPAANELFANMKDDAGTTTTVGLQFSTVWAGTNNLGSNTGNNSGVFPDAVLRGSIYVSASRSVKIVGLTPTDKYSLTFMSSRANPTVGVVGNFTVNGQTQSLNGANNTQSTVSFNNLTPAADGSITFSLDKASGSSYAYLNAVVIKSNYDDGSAPAKPRNLAAANIPGKIRLTWTDAAYNETSYEVYKATNIAGPYTLVTPGGNNANLVQFEDASIAGNTTYYYSVRTVNSYGASPYSDTVSITAPNVNPVLTTIPNTTVLTGQSSVINVTASDPGDVITLSAANLPSFASFTDNGNGTGSIQITNPLTSGVFNNITVTATDNNGGSSSKSFTLTVNNADLTKILVNFNQTNPAAAPWNNTNAAPTANFVLSNLKDQNNQGTGINLTLLDAMTGQSNVGVNTGNNSGIFPDVVMQYFWYYNAADARRVKLSGLSPNKKYDLSFFGSRANNATPLVTRYTVGAQSVELDANNNSTNVAKITGLTADANGEIIFSAQRSVGPNVYLGALVIDAYNSVTSNPTAPTGLTAVGTATDRIQLKWNGVVNNSGYQVFRASTAAGTYTKIADVATNTVTYLNTGLTAGTTYYYKVKAVVNGNPTDFSNYAGASTVSYTVLLNMNDGSVNAPAQTTGNWNNINALVSNGFTLSNMINTTGLNTGINFMVTKTFSGFNYYGATTNNNSGVYPDNVMKNFYYFSYADTAKIRITGLTLAHVYNFVFFGSRVNPSISVVGGYRIGNTTVTLDATNNTQNTVKISGVVPDATGSVDITLFAVSQGGVGYLNALAIEGAPAVASEGQTLTARGVSGTVQTGDYQQTAEVATNARSQAAAAVSSETEPQITVDVFPNPFRDDVTLKFDLKDNFAKFTVLVSDLSGKIVRQIEVENPGAGTKFRKLGLNGQTLPKGVYLVRVVGIPGQSPAPLKIVKE